MSGTPRVDPLCRRIVTVLGNLDLGGSERQALLLARHLSAEHRADVRVWALRGEPGRAARICDAEGLPWRCFRLGWPEGRSGRLREAARFAAALRRERPGLVLAYTWLPNILCGLAWRGSGARSFVWNQRDEGRGLTRGMLHRLAARATPWFLCNNEPGKDFLAATYGVPSERLRLVRNGVILPPPGEGRREWRERIGIEDGRIAAVMLASVHPHKDHATLIRAWRAVLDGAAGGGPPPVLLLAGRSYGFEEGLKALAFDLGLGESVRFLGEVDDIGALLGAADLCVHAAHREGLPNAVLEAMAAGLPVAATDLPGIREAVGPEGAGLLAPPEDPAALAERIVSLLSSERLRAATGAALKERATRRFDAAAVCRETAGFLRSVLGGTP